MKSKMKTTFAIIAVALMVLVAVVPMIGIFTDSTDAITTKDPSTDSNKITVNVKLYSNATTPALTTGTIQAVYKVGSNTYTEVKTISNSTNGVNFELYESSVDEFTATYVTYDAQSETYKAVVGWDPVTIKGLKDDGTHAKTYNVSVTSGMKVKEVKFAFANASFYSNQYKNLITKTIIGEKMLQGKYSIYTSNSAEATPIVEGAAFDITIDNDGQYVANVFYPISVADSFYVTVDEFSGITGLSYNATTKQLIEGGSGKDLLKAKQSVFCVAPTSTMLTAVTVKSITGTNAPGEGDPVPITGITILAADMLYVSATKETDAFFAVEIPTTGTNTFKVTFIADGYDSPELALTVVPENGTTSYVATHAFYGNIYLPFTVGSTTTKYYQSGKITVEFLKADSTTEKITRTVTVDDEGNFYQFEKDASVKDTTVTPATDGTYTVKKYVLSDQTEFAPASTAAADFTGKAALSISLDNTNNVYSKVSGALKCNSVVVPGKTLTVTGAKTFGSLTTITSTSATNGTYDFLAQNGKTIEFTVSGATLSGSTKQVVGISSTGAELIMSTQTVSVVLQDVLGNPILNATTMYLMSSSAATATTYGTFTHVANDTKGKYEATIRGDITVSDCFVKYAAGEINSAYVKDNVYNTTSSDGFKVQVQKLDGTAIYNTDSSKVLKVFAAKAYKTSIGTIIYNYNDQAPITLTGVDAKELYTFSAKKADLQKTKESIGSTVVDVYVAIVDTTSTGAPAKGLYFNDIYLLTIDSKGLILIKAATDSVSGKVVRQDGTGIPGVTVDVKANGTDISSVEKVYTDKDGNFTIGSSAKLSKTATKFVLTDPAGKYPTSTVNWYKDGVKQTSFTFDKDAYTFSYYDADGVEIDLTPSATVTYTKKVSYDGGAAAAIGTQYAWKVGKTVALTIDKVVNNEATTYRTFSIHTLTADEVKTGKVTFVSDQKTYTAFTCDSDANLIGGVALTIYKYESGVPVATTTQYTTEADKTKETFGTVSFLLPRVGATVAASDAADSEYAVLATKLGEEFSTDPVKITSTIIAISSAYEELVFVVLDAAGDNLVNATLSTATVYKDGELLTSALAPSTATILGVQYKAYTLTNDPEAEYTFEIKDATAGGYTFSIQKPDEDGFLYANEEWVYGDIVDAAGEAIGVDGTTDVYAYVGNIPVWTSSKYVKTEAAGHYYKILVIEDLVTGYGIRTATQLGDYTFEISESPVIEANELTVSPAFVSTNGVLANAPTKYVFYAYYYNGVVKKTAEITSATAVGKLIVNPLMVEYYAVEAKEASEAGHGYFVTGETYYADTPLIVSPFMKVTGSLPTKTVDGDYVNVELWKDGVVVDGVGTGNLGPNEVDYTVYVDISGNEDAVAGVAFDSITATYVHNGAVYAVSEVNPASAYNPIVTEPGYALVLIGSDFILEHTDFAVVGNVAYLTADTMFEIVVQTTQVEGKQVVEKYTFAGWYVNGKAVNASEPSISVELTEFANTASAKYTVETYEVVEPTPEPTPAPAVDNSIDPTVLVIGICAVIVALIAVAYAVISSRPKEKKE